VIQLEAVIEQVWRITWRPPLSKMGREPRGSQSGGGCLTRRPDVSWDSIDFLAGICVNLESWVQYGLPTDEGQAGTGSQSILG
jgi:hypothetical protein